MSWASHTAASAFNRALFSPGGLFNSEAFNYEINRLGWEHWELINVFDTNMIQGVTRNVVAVFKRPLTEERRAEISSKVGSNKP